MNIIYLLELMLLFFFGSYNIPSDLIINYNDSLVDGNAFGSIIKDEKYIIEVSLKEVDKFDYEFNTSFFIPEIINQIGFGYFNIIFSFIHELFHYKFYKEDKPNTEEIVEYETYLFLLKCNKDFLYNSRPYFFNK